MNAIRRLSSVVVASLALLVVLAVLGQPGHVAQAAPAAKTSNITDTMRFLYQASGVTYVTSGTQVFQFTGSNANWDWCGKVLVYVRPYNAGGQTYFEFWSQKSDGTGAVFLKRHWYNPAPVRNECNTWLVNHSDPNGIVKTYKIQVGPDSTGALTITSELTLTVGNTEQRSPSSMGGDDYTYLRNYPLQGVVVSSTKGQLIPGGPVNGPTAATWVSGSIGALVQWYVSPTLVQQYAVTAPGVTPTLALTNATSVNTLQGEVPCTDGYSYVDFQPGQTSHSLVMRCDNIDYTLAVTNSLGWGAVYFPDQAPTGLWTTNDGPTELGSPTLFSAFASGKNVSYAWDFGDGTLGSGITATHIYTAVGSYTAIVTGTNSGGFVTTTTSVEVIDVAISGLAASCSDSEIFVGQVITCTATISTGSNAEFSWGPTVGSDMYLGQVVSMTFEQSGIKVIYLTASNGRGSLNTHTSVWVKDLPPSNLSLAFSNSPAIMGQPTIITLTASGLNLNNWSIDTGQDGGFYQSSVITHVFAAAGVYSITGRVGNTGGVGIVRVNLTVIDLAPGPVSITFSSNPTHVNASVTMTATATGDSVAYKWYVDEVVVGLSQTLIYTPTSVGAKTIRADATNPWGSRSGNANLAVVPWQVFLPTIIR